MSSDARSFAHFLTARLKEALAPLEGTILGLVSQDIDKNANQLYRSAGARDMLIELISKMEPLAQDFYNSNSAALATVSPAAVSSDND